MKKERIERVPLGSGYLHLKKTDLGTLRLGHTPDDDSFMIGIYIPIGAIQTYGELIAIPLASRRDYLAGEHIAIGEGVIFPHDEGIRIREREDTSRNKLNGAAINRLIRAGLQVILVFNAER